MKLYDISQEVFSSSVYPGDRPPQRIEEKRMARGDTYNLTSFRMCAHNGTHMDAPFHFLNDRETIDEISLGQVVGECYVAACGADIRRDEALSILSAAAAAHPACSRRILLAGEGDLTPEGAAAFAEAGVCLLGVEGQSAGPISSPMEVHKLLLSSGCVLLEGICLSRVPEGAYFLCAAPLSLGGADGAPVRAFLIDFHREE